MWFMFDEVISSSWPASKPKLLVRPYLLWPTIGLPVAPWMSSCQCQTPCLAVTWYLSKLLTSLPVSIILETWFLDILTKNFPEKFSSSFNTLFSTWNNRSVFKLVPFAANAASSAVIFLSRFNMYALENLDPPTILYLEEVCSLPFPSSSTRQDI